jgi:hypothetical protein
MQKNQLVRKEQNRESNFGIKIAAHSGRKLQSGLNKNSAKAR